MLKSLNLIAHNADEIYAPNILHKENDVYGAKFKQSKKKKVEEINSACIIQAQACISIASALLIINNNSPLRLC